MSAELQTGGYVIAATGLQAEARVAGRLAMDEGLSRAAAMRCASRD